MSALADLVPSILQKTLERKLEWEDLSTGSFIARLGEHSLEVSQLKGDNSTRLALLDSNGRVLESISWTLLSAPTDKQLIELYQGARRQALRIDTALDDIAKNLKNL